MLKIILSLMCLLAATLVSADVIAPSGQSIQIYTHLQKIIGKPSWLLVLRNRDSGQVYPYLYDIRQNDNFWVAFTGSSYYEVVTSTVKFNEEHSINNFCGIEGVKKAKSLYITITGVLAPNRSRSTCHVLRYRDMPLPIAN